MANFARKLGGAIYTFMSNVKVTPEAFAKELGLSEKDVWNIIEGKVVVPPLVIDRIADVLSISKDNLLNFEENSMVPELQFMTEFSNSDHLDKILDLIDEYVELKEAI